MISDLAVGSGGSAELRGNYTTPDFPTGISHSAWLIWRSCRSERIRAASKWEIPVEGYRRLMDHWQRVLRWPWLEVDYEELVEDMEGVSRRIVNWCRLEWEPGCLSFHQTRRPVRTASATQVRRPIYKTSVGRWKNYEASLGGLLAKVHCLDWPRPEG